MKCHISNIIKRIMLLNRHLTVLIIVIAFTAHLCVANSFNYYFKQISLSDGLSQSSVRDILHDADGFIWFATKVGLNKYDHQTISSYYHVPSVTTSLPDNEVNFVMKDSTNTIWVGCESGLSIYNNKSDDFSPVVCDGERISAFSYCLEKDGIIFGGSCSIYKYYYSSKKTVKLPCSGTPNQRFNYIFKWSKNTYVVSTIQRGIWLYDIKTGEFSQFRSASQKDIAAAFVDSRSNLWISPYGQGLLCFDRTGKLIYSANTSNSDLSSNFVRDINQLDNKLWIGTDGSGINILDLTDKSYSHIVNKPGIRNSFPEYSVIKIYKDDESNIWVGTVRGGAIFIRKTNMQTFSEVAPGSKYGLTMRTVNYLFQDSHNNIWIGTDGKGVNKFDAATNNFTSYGSTDNMKVTSIAQTDDSHLLLSTYTTGFYLFDINTGTTTSAIDINNYFANKNIRKGITTAVKNIDNGKIVFYADNVFVYNVNTRTFEEAKIADNSTSVSTLSYFYNDKRRVLYFCKNSLMSHDLEQNIITPFLRLDKDCTITCAQFDGKDNIYIGTNTKLYKYIVSKRHLSELDAGMYKGLNSLTLNGDDLWIGACNTLFLRSLSIGKTCIFGQTDGVEINEFINKSHIISKDNDVYIGGVNGLLKIDADAITENQNSGKDIHFSLADIIIDGVSAFSKIDENTVSIPSNHSSINIKIIDKEKDVFRRKLFRFYIEQSSDVKLIETYDRSITINMLSPGTYNISVACSKRDGSWTTPQNVIKLRVLAPWYNTVWFYLGLFSICILATVLIFRYSYYRKKELMRKQIREHQRQNDENKVNFLININHELRTPLTLIYSPLKRLLQQSKTQGSIDSETTKQLANIYRQAKKMRNIINMILDLRQLEAGHTKVRYSTCNVNEWVAGITNDFEAECTAKSISLIINLDNKLTDISFDKDKCEIILSNLIMNALKYTPENTNLTVTTEEKNGFVRISVTDCGIGINDTDLEKIFEMFYQSENAIYGTGIGLSYAKSLVELQNGRIGAYNNANVPGVTFWFEIPLAQTVSTKQETVDLIQSLSQTQFEHSTYSNDFSTNELSAIVIEDDVELCDTIAEDLEPYFKTIFKAYNGKEGLKKIKHSLPDIIVSDVMLPLMNGYELCHILKSTAEYQHIPIILLSAQTVKDAADTSIKLGADYYLAKPFEIDELMSICKNLLLNRTLIKNKYRDTPNNTAKQSINNADESFLSQINAIINKNIENPDFGVNDIVNELHMGRTNVYGKLKELTQLSLGDYVNQYKLKLAKEMLNDKTMSINAISFELGFRSQRYFSTFFKHLTGETPSEYRSKLTK